MLTKHVLYQLSHSSICDSLVIIADCTRFVKPFFKKNDKYFLFFFDLGIFCHFFDLFVMLFAYQHIY